MSQTFRQKYGISRVVRVGILLGVLWTMGFGAGEASVYGTQEGSRSNNPSEIWQRDIDAAGVQSAKDGRLLLLHFWAPDNAASRKMEQNFYGNPQIAKQLTEDYLCVPINGPQNAELLEKLDLPVVFPTDLVLRIDGDQSDVLSVHSGEIPAREYLKTLRGLAKEHRRPQTAVGGEIPPTLDEVAIPTTQPLTPEAGEIPDARFEFNTPETTLLETTPTETPDGTDVAQTHDIPPTGEDRSANTPIVPPMDLPMDPNRFETSNPVVSTELKMETPDNSRFESESESPQLLSEEGGLELSELPELPELPGMEPMEGDELAETGNTGNTGNTSGDSLSSKEAPGEKTVGNIENIESSDPLLDSSVTPFAIDEVEPAVSLPGLASQTQITPPEAELTIEEGTPTTIAGFTAEESLWLRKSPLLALNGYSPVAITTSMRWVRGDVRFGAVHRGRTYLFASAEESREFLADPERYAPALSGYDVVTAVQDQKLVPGVREVAARIAGRIWLFTSEENYDVFAADPEKYIDAAERIVQKSEQQAAREARYRSGSLFR